MTPRLAPFARLAGFAALALACVMAAAAACSGPPADARIGVDAPDRATFPPAADVLDHRCGSIDCHGARTRNLQIFGCEGLRLGDATPGCRISGGTQTTDEEYDATYRSLVGLEPAVMSAVVQGKGAHPELLTFVRKARGTEAHKGGTIFTPGDDQDTCVVSWLAGAVDQDACTRALTDPVVPR